MESKRQRVGTSGVLDELVCVKETEEEEKVLFELPPIDLPKQNLVHGWLHGFGCKCREDARYTSIARPYPRWWGTCGARVLLVWTMDFGGHEFMHERTNLALKNNCLGWKGLNGAVV